MKLISLNLWGGRIKEPLKNFLEQYKEDTDIFCFQEMYHQAGGKIANVAWIDEGIENDLFEKIGNLLPEHKGFFYPHFEDFWGLAMFVKKDVPILEEADTFVHHSVSIEETLKGGTSKNIQYILTEQNGKKLNIVNFHGLWNGKGKNDSESRFVQSRNIVEFLESLSGEVVLSGDFNLKPNTESLKMIEDFGFKNLIKKYGITSTRTSLYAKEEKMADYTLVTSGVRVKEFRILPDEVSDHNAMYLEFEV